MNRYGANVVRLAMYIDDSSNGGSYISKPDYFKNLIKQSIAETKSSNMYCIVDWHINSDSLSSGDPNDYIAESKDFFGEISKYCADNGYDNVLYEICNEPTCGWLSIKNYAEEVIPVITANQPDAIVIVGTDQWCQKIMEPVSNPISSQYKKNVMYSFHYSACSHYSLLGDFRNAQKNIPVFVSEWSSVKYNGEGPFCKENSDEFISNCDYTSDVAPQVVSWCLWNWGGEKDASSFLENTCDAKSFSSQTDNDGRNYFYYVLDLMEYCGDSDFDWDYYWMRNTIPTTKESLWRWDYYSIGGESMAYHDRNSGAWNVDETGAVLNYLKDGDEVDVFSLAEKMRWMNKNSPWSTVEDGKVVSWSDSINTLWKDSDGNPTYKSLNAGRNYFGPNSSIRPDEGVDLNVANLKGTIYENMEYSSLYLVEEDEWIEYMVEVEKPGYYKLKGIVSSEYKAANKRGEISIDLKEQNILRDASTLADDNEITSFGFPKTKACADDSINISDIKNCWSEVDAISGDHKTVLAAFPKAGTQNITIRFSGDASGVGPLIFEWYKELESNDPLICNDCDNWNTFVDDVYEVNFSINPNPTSGEFAVILAEDIEATVDVVNMAGQVVASQRFEGTTTINNALTAGVYTVVVKSNAGVSTQKLIVK